MTNPVFDDNERGRWLADANVGVDPRFAAVLRIDPLLRDYASAAKKLARMGICRFCGDQSKDDRRSQTVLA